MDALSSAFGSSSFTSNIDDGSAGVVNLSDSATTGSWSVNVSDYGASTTFVLSGLAGVADPSTSAYVSSSAESIVIDADGPGSGAAVTLSLHPANQSLNALVDEINKVAGTKVQASIVNVGSGSSPNYQLSLQSRTVSPADIKLVDGTSEYGNTDHNVASTRSTRSTAPMFKQIPAVLPSLPALRWDLRAHHYGSFYSQSRAVNNICLRCAQQRHRLVQRRDHGHGQQPRPDRQCSSRQQHP